MDAVGEVRSGAGDIGDGRGQQECLVPQQWRVPARAGGLAQRRRLADRYFDVFSAIDGAVLPPQGVAGQSWNMFCVLLPYEALGTTRQAFRAALRERDIATGLSYEPSHLTTLGRNLGWRAGQFPNAERIGRETVTLPLHCGMTDADVDRVCAAVAEVLGVPAGGRASS